MNHLVYWIWLSLRCGAGSELGSYLLKHFETPKDIYEATKEELLAMNKKLNRIRKPKKLRK